MWEGGASLSFTSQQCREVALLNGKMQTEKMNLFLAEILLSLALFAGRAGGYSRVAASVVHP